MDLKWSEPIRKIRETVIRELLKGKESTTRLQTLLKKNPSGDGGGSVSAEELTLQISTSFTESISILSSCGVNELRQIVATTDAAVGDSSGDRRSKTSDHSRKRLGVKDRRGCYRRRNVSESWITVSPTVEDGHAWRKYGQKEILNTNFPRCYFRCTHKHDQGCKATKQVQRINEEPRMYQTTYFGHHTCQDTTLLTAPQFISDSDPIESNLLSFRSTKTPTTKHDQNPICPNNNYAKPTTPTAAVNHQDQYKDEAHSDVSDNKSCLDSSPMLQDVITNSVSSEFPKSSKISEANHYHEEVVSSVQRSCSSSSTPLPDLDMEPFATKFDAIDDDLYFDDMAGFFQDFP